jgi:hypothetical protein
LKIYFAILLAYLSIVVAIEYRKRKRWWEKRKREEEETLKYKEHKDKKGKKESRR